MCRHLQLLVLALAVVTCLLFAPGCQGTGGPPNPSLSTPAKAAMVYLKAIQRADARTARNAAVGTADQKSWVDALAALVDGMRKFDTALYARFGRIILQIHTDMHDALHGLADEPVELMVDAKVLADEKKARIDPPRRGFTSHFQPSIYLVHDTEGWKVDLAQTYGENLSPEQMKAVSANFRRYGAIGQVFRGVAADVQANRFRSTTEVERVLAERLKPVMSRE